MSSNITLCFQNRFVYAFLKSICDMKAVYFIKESSKIDYGITPCHFRAATFF